MGVNFLQCLSYAECCSDHIISRVKNWIPKNKSPIPIYYFYFFKSYVSVCGMFTWVQKPGILDCQEMELQVVVSHPTWVLGEELQSSAVAVSNQPLLFSQHSFKNAVFSPLSYTCRPQESALCRPLSSLWPWNLWSAGALVSLLLSTPPLWLSPFLCCYISL